MENITKRILALVLVLLLPILLAACTQKALYNIENQPVAGNVSGEQPTLETVEKAIVEACRRKGWIPRKIADGMFEASLLVRSHRAVITIRYDTDTYSITYKDSANLDYRKRSGGDESIHRNYNRWIRNLDRLIQTELSIATLSYE